VINARLFDWYGIDTTKNLGIANVCPKPFDTVLIDKQGSCYLCECTSWLPQSAGNLHTQSLADILSSPITKMLQTSVADGSYRYCNNKQCTWIIKNDVRNYGKNIPELSEIRLAIDDSCNLSCPSCRTHQIFEKDKNKLRRLYKLADKIIDYVGKQSNIINIHVGSDGDPFASLVYRYFIKGIKDLPNVRFTIQTNGLLIKKMYQRHLEMFKKLDILNISIDGATKTTYELLRRGGQFEKLLENLEFIKDYHQQFAIKFHMVVQKRNWQDMAKM
jgi:organic radical activating enzyme